MEYNSMFHNPVEQPNYFVVDVTEKKLIIKTMFLDGTLLDEFFIDKEKDTSSDMIKQSPPAGSREAKPAA